MGWSAIDKPRAARAALLACLLAFGASGPIAAARGVRRTAPFPGPGDYSVALEQCVSSGSQPERSATFVAQMVASAGTQKMAMKIALEERGRGEAEYHSVLAPGLGVWRAAEPGVKVYKYVKQVTNLPAPASYRAVVRFRWVGDRGRTIKRAEARSARCFQPAPSASSTSGGSAAGA
jgi:hypothetical protein